MLKNEVKEIWFNVLCATKGHGKSQPGHMHKAFTNHLLMNIKLQNVAEKTTLCTPISALQSNPDIINDVLHLSKWFNIC